MRTAWKILAGAAVLVAVVLIGVAIAISTVDVNALIGPVKARVKAVTGRELTVRGGADLRFSLEPKLVLKDVSIANAPWGAAPALASAQRLELQIALLPLLSRRFEVIELALVDPAITLETDNAGRGNWELGKSEPPAPAGAAADDAATATPAVGNLAITGGTLTWRDARSGHVTTIAIEKLALRSRSAQAPIAAQFSGKVDGVPVAVEGTLGPLESLLQQRWPYPVALKGHVDGTATEVSTRIGKEATAYVLNDLDLRVGANVVGGKFSIVMGGPRPKLVFGLAAATLVVADLPLPVAARPAPAGAATAGKAWMFSDTPVDFSHLRAVDADGRIAVGKLRFAAGREADNVKVQLSLVAGRLDVTGIEAAMLGGSLAGSALIDAAAPADPTLLVRFNGNGLDLGAILTALGKPREVRGGKTDLVVDLAMRGTSPHAWAGSATGNVRVVAGRATLVNTRLDVTSPLDKLFAAVNPFRESDPATELVCAVIRMPFANGIARVDRTVAIETNKLGVLASGTLDLRNETVDFTIQPKVHSGIPVNIPGLADLVRFSGPMTAPQVQVDAKASVAAIASVGAAVSTGGLSVIGQALFSRAEDGGATACQIALGQKGSAAASGKAAGAGTTNPLEDVGKAVGRLFGK
jgi:uncharacterized protein involved in outer membrane biogenesis